jgi:tRNA threonylcarbamoyladenosine biosynthesis protein TsaB
MPEPRSQSEPMLPVLALDTATESIVLGVQVEGRFFTRQAAGGAASSTRLIPLIHALLADAGIALRDLRAVAFGQGPGAFTGLRAACAVAQGLGFGLGRPLLPIDSLRVVAEDARVQADAGDGPLDFAVAMDARMDEVYAARYRWHAASGWQVLAAPALFTLPALAQAWGDLPPHRLAGSALPAFGARPCGCAAAPGRARGALRQRHRRRAGLAAVPARQGGADHARARRGARRHPRADAGMSACLRPRPVRRAMTLSDLDAVLAIETGAYPFPWTRGNFIDSLAAGYRAEVLAEDGELLGYFVAMAGVDELHLLNVTVAPPHQSQGHGQALLAAVRAHALALQLPRVLLEVRQSNQRAQALYRRLGFVEIGQRRNYYPAAQGREDAIVMGLRLDGDGLL